MMNLPPIYHLIDLVNTFNIPYCTLNIPSIHTVYLQYTIIYIYTPLIYNEVYLLYTIQYTVNIPFVCLQYTFNVPFD